MKTSKAVGIDLGTTNSVIAMVGEDGQIICRTDRSGRRTFPSVVVYDRRSDSLKSGAIAFGRRGTRPEPIVSIKSHMGDADYRATTGSLTLSPIEVSAAVLKEMKEQMQAYLAALPGYEDYVVDRAVVTIPAYFASNAREATAKAGELAGLKVEFTLQEPTAAVLYYCQHNDIDDGVFLVYDLGGGTFDCSVVKVDGGDVVVIGIAGNNYLGGDNFDELLARHLLAELEADPDADYDLSDFDPNHDEEDRRRLTKLKLEAEIIKKSLSLKDEHYEECAGLFTDKAGAQVNLAVTVTRAQFEDLIRPLLESTLEECRKALAKAEADYHVTLDMVDAVLLVGGSTHIPLVSDFLAEAFTNPDLPLHTKQPLPLKDEPDMAVGYGAAIAAAGQGTASLDEVAYAVASGDAEAVAALGLEADELVLAPEFRPGSGYGGESVVEGKLTALRGTLPATVYARVTRAAGGFTAEFPVAPDGSFAFTGLEAPADPEPYACEFLAGGQVIGTATFDAAIRNARHASVALSRNYYIQTVDAEGNTVMVELMRQGEELPISRDYRFATNPTNQYFAELRFFEEGDFLKQITLSFDAPVAPGTEVKLSLSCSLQSKFAARAEVAGTVVDTQFEPSPAPPLPTAADVNAEVRAARQKVEQIKEPGRRIVAAKQLDRLANEIDSALDEADSGKARDKLGELRGLDVGGSQFSPNPPRERFEQLVLQCEQLNDQREAGQPDSAADIAASARDGRKAYEASDQDRLTKAVKELEALAESLKPAKSGGDGGGGDARPPLWMLCQHFGPEVGQLMDRADARTDLPAAFRADKMGDLAIDRSALRQALAATRMPMPDDEATPHWDAIRRLYQKWEAIANIIGLPVASGLPQ
jgi:molecular chaperone DnaK